MGFLPALRHVTNKKTCATKKQRDERCIVGVSNSISSQEKPFCRNYQGKKEQIMSTSPQDSGANTLPQGYTRLASSERQPLAGAHPLGSVDPNERVEVTVYLRAPSTSNLADRIAEQVQQQSRPLTREEYAAHHSAAPDDIAKVEQFARKHDLTVVETDPVSRKVVLAGTAAAMSAAFAVKLQRYEYAGRTYRGRTGHVHIPKELDQIVVAVLGLDDRPQTEPRLRYYDPGVQARAATNSY